MHIPDGFLDTKTALLTGLFSLGGLSTSLRHASRHTLPREVPLIGLSAAFVFVAQMINFPVAGGTSGHLLGATLVTVLLGPSVAVIVMTCVLIIQSLIFADGGLLALGANVLNMAIVAPVLAFGVYQVLYRSFSGRRGQLIAASIAAWISTVVSAIVCAGELALSGTASWSLVFPAMAGIHALIGIGEGAVTMLVLAAIGNTRPELLAGIADQKPASERKTIFVYVAIVILGLLILVVPYASKLPDGLEKVASSLGFEYKATSQHQLPALMKNYVFPGAVSPEFASIIAALTGAVAVLALSIVLARILIPKKATPSPSSSKID